MMKKVLPLAGVIAVPVLLAVAGGALTSDDAPPNVSSEPAVTDRELPPAPRAGDAGDDGGAAGDDSGDDSGRDSGDGAGGSDSGADGAGGLLGVLRGFFLPVLRWVILGSLETDPVPRP